MRALLPDPAGGVRLDAVPDPVAGPGEVLVEVAAAGVNRADLLQLAGHYPTPPGAPAWPGLEVSGTVLTGADGLRPGDEVCALLPGGGWAERVAVDARHVLPVPRGVALHDAAALPEAVATVWSNLVTTARLRPGEWLLVHGGASGIGTMAVQVGRALGARVAVTAGTVAGRAAARELGAEVAIDYRTEDFSRVVREASGGHGADVVLDVVGARYLAANLDALATGGRLVVIGLQGGRRAELDLAALMARRATVAGTTLRGRGAEDKAGILAEVRERVWPLVAAGTVRPVVDRHVDWARAEEALAALDGAHVGKVVLDVRPR